MTVLWTRRQRMITFKIDLLENEWNDCCGSEGLLMEIRVYQRRLVGKQKLGMYG
jgi:hypothetical protein